MQGLQRLRQILGLEQRLQLRRALGLKVQGANAQAKAQKCCPKQPLPASAAVVTHGAGVNTAMASAWWAPCQPQLHRQPAAVAAASMACRSAGMS